MHWWSIPAALTMVMLTSGAAIASCSEPPMAVPMATAETVRFQFVNAEGEAVNEAGEPITGRTQTDFLREQVQLEAGQPLQARVIQQDIGRLCDLDLFQSVTASFRAIPDNPQQVVVVYNLQERSAQSVSFSGGFGEGDTVYVGIGYRDRNVGGVGEQVRASTEASRYGLQYDFTYVSPYRPATPSRLGFQVESFRQRRSSPTYTDEVVLPNGDRIREGRIGVGVAVSRPIGGWEAQLGLNYTRVSLRDRKGEVVTVDEQDNPLSVSGRGIDNLATLSLELSQDDLSDRDNPETGSRLSFRASQSIPLSDRDASFQQLQADYVQYLPINLLTSEASEQPELLAFNLQGGTAIGDLPPYEAFNLGGPDSVRGYGSGAVGSGRSYILASAEYRFPVFDPVGAVLFADFASDLGSGDTVLGEPGPVRDKPGAGFGYGIGLRIESFLGLIRADFGLNDQGNSELFLGIGQRF